jgi:hypothetical protein
VLNGLIATTEEISMFYLVCARILAAVVALAMLTASGAVVDDSVSSVPARVLASQPFDYDEWYEDVHAGGRMCSSGFCDRSECVANAMELQWEAGEGECAE